MSLIAHVSALSTLEVPEALRTTLRSRGLDSVDGDPASVQTAGGMAFPLIWVGHDWQAGLSLLSGMPVELAEARMRSVLIGEAPPTDIGPRIRQIGALTYALADFPSWLLEPISEALARLSALTGTPAEATSHALLGKGVQREAEKLLAVGALAASLLNANSASILVREAPSATIQVLIGAGDTLRLVPWREVFKTDPCVFFEAAETFGGQVAYPCLEYARSVPGETAAALPHSSALATVVHAGEEMHCAMLLLWSRPYLLNANEVASLDTLAFIARKAWPYTRMALAEHTARPPTSSVSRTSWVPPADARLNAVLQTVTDLMGIPGAMLVLRDREEQPERLFYAADWWRSDLPALGEAHRALCCDCPRQPLAWHATIQENLTQLDARAQVLDVMQLPAAEDGLPQGALVLLSVPRTEAKGENIQRMLLFSAAQEILRVAWLTFELDERMRAEAEFDRFASSPSAKLSDLLLESAKLIGRATRADLVFVKFGHEHASDPAIGDAVRVGVSNPSVTKRAKREGVCIRLLDVYDEQRATAREVDHVSLRKLLTALGWTKLRSMIVYPFADGRGIVKVYTQDTGAFLTASDAKLVRTVADKLGQIAVRAVRWDALHDLNELASEIAGLAGAQLANAIVERLEKWTAQFIRPDCQVLLSARDARGATVLEGVSSSMTQQTRSMVATGTPLPQLIRVPLALQKAHGLTGELCVWNDQPLPRSAADYVTEAAREISIVLYAEHVRHEAREQFGILRHGVVGPLQGLVSHANLLRRRAQKATCFDAEMDGSVRRILDETHNIEEWNLRHRLFASFRVSGRLELRPQRAELRPVVEKCARRFQEAMDKRGLTLRLNLPTGGVQAEFDEFALDVALSNLIDNAVKYAFYNREITVSIDTRSRSGFLGIWIEDIGHGIPADRAELIYAPGGRVGQFDPLRVIHGEGLGLYIARAIALAHDGDLKHTVKVEGRSVNNKTPYRVRFTLSLPWN
jgi:signal transduction histidine kinase